MFSRAWREPARLNYSTFREGLVMIRTLGRHVDHDPRSRGFAHPEPVAGQGMGRATRSDRRTPMRELYEAYLNCPWSWACGNAIARTITAGGLATEWDGDNEEGDQETPPKPANVLALERLWPS